ncbi:MAG: hypothetical protein CMM07_25870 [Rhodopirellula sp.]|nr:hypothetical protein [Rhodopirellula sp.]
MSGKNYLLYISDDGTVTGNKVLVESQGDLTLNTGLTVERTNFKDVSKTAQGNDGFSATFNMGLDEPVSAGQDLLVAASDGGGEGYFWIETATVGGFRWHGPMTVILSQASFPVSGEPDFSIELSENGTITRETVA